VAIGEAGSIFTNSPGVNDLIRVDFTEPLDNAVIALTATNNGGNQFALRVVNIDQDGFDFIIEEWEYLDGAHPAFETINWLAIEEGVHTLPDGRVIEAGTASTSGNSTTVGLNGGFASAPVVLTSVMSENDTTTVDSDPLNITATGFTISMQEEEAEANNHGSETVGYIAIEPGGDADSGTADTFTTLDSTTRTFVLGDTFDDAIVLADTQTINGGNPGTVKIDGQSNSDVDLVFEEEQSNDNEVFHIPETVGVVAFEDGLIPCFTPGTRIETVRGAVSVEDLQPGDLVLTADSGPRPLRWLCQTQVSPARLQRQRNLAPVVIRAGALGAGLPTRDMAVSPQHRMLITGWRAELLFGASEILVPALSLVNERSILIDRSARPVTYLHLLFDRHELVTAEGTVTESLHAGELDKAEIHPGARAELMALFPILPRCQAASAPPHAWRCARAKDGCSPPEPFPSPRVHAKDTPRRAKELADDPLPRHRPERRPVRPPLQGRDGPGHGLQRRSRRPGTCLSKGGVRLAASGGSERRLCRHAGERRTGRGDPGRRGRARPAWWRHPRHGHHRNVAGQGPCPGDPGHRRGREPGAGARGRARLSRQGRHRPGRPRRPRRHPRLGRGNRHAGRRPAPDSSRTPGLPR
jgi:hypothetical protein